MTVDIYYKEDLLELTPQDIEESYWPFIDIDKVDSYGDTLLLAACRNKQILGKLMMESILLTFLTLKKNWKNLYGMPKILANHSINKNIVL